MVDTVFLRTTYMPLGEFMKYTKAAPLPGAVEHCRTGLRFSCKVKLFRLTNRKESSFRASRSVLIPSDEHLTRSTGMTLGLLSRRKANLPYLPPLLCTGALTE
jgi:hypothetical protein